MKTRALLVLVVMLGLITPVLRADTIDFNGFGGGTWTWDGVNGLNASFNNVQVYLTSGGSTVTLTGSQLSFLTGILTGTGGGTFTFGSGGSIVVSGTGLTCGSTANPQPTGSDCFQGTFTSFSSFNNAAGNTITFTGNFVTGVVDTYILTLLGLPTGNQNVIGSISGSLSGQLSQCQTQECAPQRGDAGSTDLLVSTPEPSSMLLLGAGLTGLAGILRKKFRKS